MEDQNCRVRRRERGRQDKNSKEGGKEGGRRREGRKKGMREGRRRSERSQWVSEGVCEGGREEGRERRRKGRKTSGSEGKGWESIAQGSLQNNLIQSEHVIKEQHGNKGTKEVGTCSRATFSFLTGSWRRNSMMKMLNSMKRSILGRSKRGTLINNLCPLYRARIQWSTISSSTEWHDWIGIY